MPAQKSTAPILTSAQSVSWENKLLGGEEANEWDALQRAGETIGRAIVADIQEAGPGDPVILLLLGKGHNAGDALLAAAEIADAYPGALFRLLWCQGSALRPLVQRSVEHLYQKCGDRIESAAWRNESGTPEDWARADIVIDGLLGMQFRPPLRESLPEVLRWANESLNARMRCAVDLPSGIGDEGSDLCFRAEFTYAPGIAKAPLFDARNAEFVGCIRFLDIGFFDVGIPGDRCSEELLTDAILESLRRLRPAQSEKRGYGHLFVVGGSRKMPGSVAMTVEAALHSGAGLVTAFVPESAAPALAARLPEAMWVSWPETPEGGLALEGYHLLAARLSKATALVCGPGMTTEAEVTDLIKRLVGETQLPVLLDADALVPAVVEKVRQRSIDAGAVVLTPHLGEFRRLAGRNAGQSDLAAFARDTGALTLLKGYPTRISNGERVAISPFGNAVLARGGSGDLLAGIIGSQLARPDADAFEATCCGTVWHGLAADQLAHLENPNAICTTQLLDYLGDAL